MFLCVYVVVMQQGQVLQGNIYEELHPLVVQLSEQDKVRLPWKT